MDRNKTLANAFNWLFIGLLVCGIVSYVASLNAEKIYNAVDGLGWIILLIAELVVVLVLSISIRKLSPTTAKILYLVYTALTGLSLNGIFLVYQLGSIAFVFIITACIFGIFALIGKNTNMDLSKFGVYLFVAIIAIIILEIVNLFVLSEQLNMGLCIATIFIFCGYVAYDVNRLLKSDYLDDTPNKGIYYAFQLFIDFINIFVKLLRLFAKERD